MLSAPLVACGEDTPAVCGSVDLLKSSVDEVKDIDVTETNGLDELKSQLETIGGDPDQVTTHAKSEFSSQVDTVTTTSEALKTSAQAATTNPSADIPAAAARAWSAFSTGVRRSSATGSRPADQGAASLVASRLGRRSGVDEGIIPPGAPAPSADASGLKLAQHGSIG